MNPGDTGIAPAGTLMPPSGHLSETRRALLQHCTAVLRSSGMDDRHALQEARWLVQGGLGITDLELQTESLRTVAAEQWHRVLAWCTRRTRREPLQYILGDQEFCGLTIQVRPGVLIPRPDTEVVTEEALRYAARLPAPVIVDIGTGSGCIAVVLASRLPQASVYATDCSEQALAVARYNADRHVLPGRLTFLQGDLCEPLGQAGLEECVSVLVSNPPYLTDAEMTCLQPEVRFEPQEALRGGPDGLAVYRRLIVQALRWLAVGGRLMLEVGAGQAAAVAALVTGARSYGDLRILKDCQGIDRVVSAQRMPP